VSNGSLRERERERKKERGTGPSLRQVKNRARLLLKLLQDRFYVFPRLTSSSHCQRDVWGTCGKSQKSQTDNGEKTIENNGANNRARARARCQAGEVCQMTTKTLQVIQPRGTFSRLDRERRASTIAQKGSASQQPRGPSADKHEAEATIPLSCHATPACHSAGANNKLIVPRETIPSPSFRRSRVCRHDVSEKTRAFLYNRHPAFPSLLLVPSFGLIACEHAKRQTRKGSANNR